MPLDLGARTLLYFIIDADSPQQWSAWGDKVIPLTAAELAALPTGLDTLKVTIEGSVTTIPGIRRTVSGQLQWLIRPLPDPVVTMFNALPGPGGWANTGARDTWAGIGQALLSKGVTPAELIEGFPALFAAARVEIAAQP
jgi:hypothetical protein